MIDPWNLEGRYIPTFGDLLQLNLREGSIIISPLQMIKHASLTFIYSKRKMSLFETYKEYEAWVNTQLSAKIKILHSDRGGEYIGKEFVAHLKSKGTVPKLTVHNTPQHNGVAEQ